jgi:hypothetical protein
MVAGTCKKRGTLRNAVPRLRTRWCSMLIAKVFRHLARRTSSLLAILAITALHPFTVSTVHRMVHRQPTHQRPPKRPLATVHSRVVHYGPRTTRASDVEPRATSGPVRVTVRVGGIHRTKRRTRGRARPSRVHTWVSPHARSFMGCFSTLRPHSKPYFLGCVQSLVATRCEL